MVIRSASKARFPAARWQGFASVGVGDDVNTHEVGVGYDIAPNWDADVKYCSSSVDADNHDDDVKGCRSAWAISSDIDKGRIRPV